MRLLTSLALIVALVPPVAAQEILLQEGFEPGFDGAGWVWTADGGDGGWSVTSSPIHSGTGSLQLNGEVGNIYLSWEFPASMRNTTAEAWFYDDMSTTLETFFSVSADPNYRILTNGHLKVGTSCAYDGGHYTIAEGWHSDGYVSGPARSPGWHHVQFQNVDGVNNCYLDGQLLHSTSFQGDWRFLILNEDNHCLTGSSWFDDVLVFQLGAVRTAQDSWGVLKVAYRR